MRSYASAAIIGAAIAAIIGADGILAWSIERHANTLRCLAAYQVLEGKPTSQAFIPSRNPHPKAAGILVSAMRVTGCKEGPRLARLHDRVTKMSAKP